MGSRDYRKHEKKKPKKEAKKVSTTNIIETPMTVEVIKKGKKEPKEGEGEE